MLKKVLQNTASLVLSDEYRRPATSGHRELGQEQVVIEEGFPSAAS